MEDYYNLNFRGISYAELDLESEKILELRQFTHIDKEMIKGSQSNIVLLNTYFDNDKAYLVGKNSKTTHPLNPPAEVCTKDHAHGSLSCSACHTSWAPQCIGCHNKFDHEAEGYDLLENTFIKGEWVEYVGQFFAEPPTLGMRTGIQKQVEPAIPGMIMTIDIASFHNDMKDEEHEIFHRLYAPVSPHTISSIGRGCKSCHNNPLAIGYGRGKLDYEINEGKGKWKFTPTFAKSKFDGLPEDAWIAFLSEPKSISSTRTDFRPFTIEEQERILTVGACLTCHSEDSQVIKASLDEPFVQYLKRVDNKCIIPDWMDN